MTGAKGSPFAPEDVREHLEDLVDRLARDGAEVRILDIASHIVIEKGAVRVEVAEPEFLLAMKLRACRPQKDLFDLAFLLRRCDVRSVEEAVDWIERFYPEDELSERDKAVVRIALCEITLPTRPPTLLAPVEPRPAPSTCRRWARSRRAVLAFPSGARAIRLRAFREEGRPARWGRPPRTFR